MLTGLVSADTYRVQRIAGGVTSFDPVTKVSSTLFAVDASGNLVLKPFTDFATDLSAYATTTALTNGLATKVNTSSIGTAAAKDFGVSAGQLLEVGTAGTIPSGISWAGSAIGDAYISSAATWNAKLAPNGSAALLTGFPTLNQNTTGTAANATLAAGLSLSGGGTVTGAGGETVIQASTAKQTLRIKGLEPGIIWDETDAGTNAKKSGLAVAGGVQYWYLANDAESAGLNWMVVNRSGVSSASVAFAAALSTSGTLTVTGASTLGPIKESPAASVTLSTNGQLAFEATSNTSLTVKYRGSDGTTRSVVLTLAP